MECVIGVSSMYVSLFENTLDVFLEDVKKHVNELDCIEIVDHTTTSLDKKFVTDSLKHLDGLKLTVHCPFEPSFNISSSKVEHRKVAIEKLKASIDYSVEINAAGFVQHPGRRTLPDDKLCKELNDQALVDLQDYCGSRGMRMGIENMPPNVGYLSTPDEFDEFVRGNNINLQMVFDIGHAHIGKTLDSFVKKYASKFMHIHVTDNDGKKDEHLNVGEGTVEWKKLISDLDKYGFTGAYVAESVIEPFKSVTSLHKLLRERSK